ncbi:MAG: acyltransferase family protein [Hyphomonas sp.]
MGPSTDTRHWPLRQYRADLDGMRAVAVLSVLAYHIDHELAPGGFVGVDVFFVLSGFFISQLLLKDLAGSDYSIMKFYDRRIRRLLPALFSMLAATSVAAVFILMPSELVRYGRSVIGAVFSISNIVFWQRSGYFAPDADTFPLLHTWSLSVEEQFYLAYPMFLWGMWKLWPRRIRLALTIVFALSFTLSVWASYAKPSAAFYLAPSRAWELAGGALLAIGVFGAPQRGQTRQVAYGAGLGIVALSIFVLNDTLAFPGYAALLPCLGTMLIIWAGLNSEPTALARGSGFAAALSWKPVVWTGLISYSLYLWHWPVLVMAEQFTLANLSLLDKIALVPVMFGLAWLSWRFVERPFRRAEFVWPTLPKRFTYSAAAAALIAAFGAGSVITHGYPGRLPPQVVRLDRARADFSPIRQNCHAFSFDPARPRAWCRFGPEEGRPVYLYADSHGAELGYALSQRAPELGLSLALITSSACPPVVGYDDRQNLNCALNNENTRKRLAHARPGTVILTAHYFRFAYEIPDFWVGYQATVEALQSAGHKVVILGPLPETPAGPIPQVLARVARLGQDPASYAFPVDDGKLEEIAGNLKSLATRTGAEYVPLMDYVCGSREECFAMHDGEPIYFDTHHMSVAMADAVTDDILLKALGVSRADPPEPATGSLISGPNE